VAEVSLTKYATEANLFGIMLGFNSVQVKLTGDYKIHVRWCDYHDLYFPPSCGAYAQSYDLKYKSTSLPPVEVEFPMLEFANG
jgi:hypothetical protein